MKRLSDRQVRQSLVGKGNLQGLLSDRIEKWDPYRLDTFEFFKDVYQDEALKGWVRVKNLFVDESSVTALENAWSVVGHSTELTGFLFKGVEHENKNNNSTVSRARELLCVVAPIVQPDPFQSLLQGNDSPSTPDLLPIEGVSDAVRLRWGLAHRTKANANFLERINCTELVSGLGALQASQLVKEAVKSSISKTSKKLSKNDVVSLSDEVFAVFVADRELIEIIYAKVDDEQLCQLKATQYKYQQVLNSLLHICVLVEERNWKEVGLVAEHIEIDQTAKLAAKKCEKELHAAINVEQNNSPHPWSNMSALGYANLQTLFPKRIVNKNWVLSYEEVSQKLILGELNQKDFSAEDFEQLNRSWDPEDRQELIDTGCYRAVPIYQPIWNSQGNSVILKAAAAANGEDADKFFSDYLRNIEKPEVFLKNLVELASKKFAKRLIKYLNGRWEHRYWRNTESGAENWDQFISSEVGGEVWRKALELSLIDKPNLDQVLFAIESNSENNLTVNFKEEFVNVLKTTRAFTHKDAKRLLGCIDLAPECSQFIGPNLSSKYVKRISELDSNASSIAALRALYKHVLDENKYDLWAKQLELVTDSEHLIELTLEGISQGFKSEWMHHWRQVSGNASSRARALILVARKDPSRLEKIKNDFTDEVIADALRWGADTLPDSCTFDKTYMELLSYLGIRHSKTLQWLLIRRTHETPSGTKFDDLYVKHEIPKKSGKMRKISAPSAGLKRIQKSINVKLLEPLGAHQAAFGFVKGKSIADNANQHVGQRVVVNADVKNCFPSVRWPLVLSALKRDFSSKLSPRSISVIVDICTAEGVLPIGAPTSPALLNRVLFKTDEILTKNAIRRNCSYSRYADDLTFSGDDSAVGMLRIATSVLEKISLELDPKKTNIFRRGRRQMCTGLVVNDSVNVPRRIRRRIRASVHAYEAGKPLHWNDEHIGPSSLRGRLEFLKMVSEKTASDLIHRFESVTTKPKGMKKKRSLASKPKGI